MNLKFYASYNCMYILWFSINTAFQWVIFPLLFHRTLIVLPWNSSILPYSSSRTSASSQTSLPSHLHELFPSNLRNYVAFRLSRNSSHGCTSCYKRVSLFCYLPVDISVLLCILCKVLHLLCKGKLHSYTANYASVMNHNQ